MGLFGKKKRVVVVGNGMVGFRFCERLLEYDAHHRYSVTVLGEEPEAAYDRVALSQCFESGGIESVQLAPRGWYRRHKIELRTQARVMKIDRAASQVVLENGERVEYDRLVLATGASPVRPPIPGAELPQVHVYRTWKDVEQIRSAARAAQQVVVIGGGLLGLEAAQACQQLGAQATVIELAASLMALQLDATGGQLLRSQVEALGLAVRTSEQVARIEAGAVTLLSGETLPTDLVILATGIRPNDQLAEAAGLVVAPAGGFAVNERLQTSDEDIYAIGECASFKERTFGLVAPGYAMAEVVAAQLGGIHKQFELVGPASQLKLSGLKVACVGHSSATDETLETFVLHDEAAGVYKKVLVNAKQERLVGAILMGETSEFESLRKLVEEENELPEMEKLLAPIGTDFVPESGYADHDLICFCNYVTKGDICKAIDRGNLETAGEVMGVTYAAGLCGSCYSQVLDVTNQHVAQRKAAAPEAVS